MEPSPIIIQVKKHLKVCELCIFTHTVKVRHTLIIIYPCENCAVHNIEDSDLETNEQDGGCEE